VGVARGWCKLKVEVEVEVEVESEIQQVCSESEPY
jgi:hypothetical protein